MSTINDILAAVSLQTALPGPFPTISEKLLDTRAAIICSSVVMQNMASSPFYLLLTSAYFYPLVYWITVSNSHLMTPVYKKNSSNTKLKEKPSYRS